MSTPYLSIVIPCFNEERNIRLGALENVSSYLQKQEYAWEVILVDDGSRDESKKMINTFLRTHAAFSAIFSEHQGKATAVSTGISKARGKYILFSDLDQATPLNQIECFFPYFQKGYHIVIGSRNARRRGAPLLRMLMAKGFVFLRNIILNLGFEDTQCGFKAFENSAAKDLFPRLLVFHAKRKARGSTVTAGFDVELLYLAKLRNWRIAEVPVEWHYQETRHVNPIKDSLESVFDLLKIRINSMRGLYQKK